MKKISVVSTAFNEEENVENLYNAVLNVFEHLPQYDYEFIVADNCSTDKLRLCCSVLTQYMQI